MMWTTQIRLSSGIEKVQDSSGFETETPSWTDPIPASRKDAGRQDRILGEQEGYTASAIYTIDAAAYDAASLLKDDATGDIYDIKRQYQAEKSRFIQLTCEVRKNGKN